MKFPTLHKIKGKIGYLDILLGTSFLIIILVFYLFFYRKVEYVDIRVKITDRDVLYANTNPKTWYANRFDIGDTEINEFGTVTSKITNVETFNTNENTKAVYLNIKIKAVYNRRTKLYSAKGTNLIFGNTIRFNFSNAYFDGLITESPNTISQNSKVIKKKRVTLLQRNTLSILEPQVLGRIKKGDKITDSNGNILVEIIDINLTPALQVTQNSRGDLLQRYNPYYKDAAIVADVSTKTFKGDEYVFDDIPLKLGVKFPLNFDFETLLPVIIDIK